MTKSYGEVQINLVRQKPFWTNQNCFGHLEGQGISILFHALAGDEMKGTLSEEDVAEIKEMFKEIDVDGSGSITSEELQKVLKEQGAKLHEAVTHVMVAMADTDGDGQINFEEFVQMTIAG